MRPYTQLGNGDFDPPEEKECETCPRCGNEASSDDDDNGFCGFRCWHLSNVGENKAHILLWKKNGGDIMKNLIRGKFLENMTPSTANRYRRAVKKLIGTQLQ